MHRFRRGRLSGNAVLGCLLFSATPALSAPAPVEPPKAIAMESWEQPGDYPEREQVLQLGGTVALTLTVRANGMPSKCVIAKPSSLPNLDRATCPVVMRSGRFEPPASRKSVTFPLEIAWTPKREVDTAMFMRVVEGLCPAPPTTTWVDAKASAKDKAYPNVYIKPYDTDYWRLLNGGPTQMKAHVANSYRACVGRTLAAVAAAPTAIMTGQQYVSCSTCRLNMSDLALQQPRLKLLEGLSYLAPERVEEQDWRRAAETIREANLLISRVQQMYVSEARAGYREKIRHRQNADSNMAMFGALLGAVAGVANPTGAASVNQQVTSMLMEAERTSQAKQRQINANINRMVRLPAAGVLSDDGVRVTVPRISPKSLKSGPTSDATGYLPSGAMSGNFALDAIVRITTGSGGWCTGSFVAPRLVATNRHCVFDENGKYSHPKQISWQYIAPGYSGSGNDPGVGQGDRKWYVSKVTYPPQDHSNRIYDWALLETATPSTVGYLDAVDPATLPEFKDIRVAVAGYSSDLNEGQQITMDWGCPATLLPGRVDHRCYLWKGASGSPMIIVNRPGMRRKLIGLQSSTEVRFDALGKQITDPSLQKQGAADPEFFRTIARIKKEQQAK
ncbi:MAG: TonB family protein [Sphingobium sp.]